LLRYGCCTTACLYLMVVIQTGHFICRISLFSKKMD